MQQRSVNICQTSCSRSQRSTAFLFAQTPAKENISTRSVHVHRRPTQGVTAIVAGSSSSSSSSSSSRRQSFVVATAVDEEAVPDELPSSAEDGSVYEKPEFPELQLQLPPPTNVLVKTADFVKSSVKVSECPPPKYPEFAVIGRSNVGKSSLINMLTNRKSLAMVSKEPGKTRCINHFLINNSWYLVDLPGYGYARTGKQSREEFDQFTKDFFLQRKTLVMVLLLVDSSIPPQTIDLQYAAWLGQRGVPFSIVFTKHDKRRKGAPKKSENIAGFKRALIEQHGFTAVPPCLITSSSAGVGKQEMLGFVASLRVLFEQSGSSSRLA